MGKGRTTDLLRMRASASAASGLCALSGMVRRKAGSAARNDSRLKLEFHAIISAERKESSCTHPKWKSRSVVVAVAVAVAAPVVVVVAAPAPGGASA